MAASGPRTMARAAVRRTPDFVVGSAEVVFFQWLFSHLIIYHLLPFNFHSHANTYYVLRTNVGTR